MGATHTQLPLCLIMMNKQIRFGKVLLIFLFGKYDWKQHPKFNRTGFILISKYEPTYVYVNLISLVLCGSDATWKQRLFYVWVLCIQQIEWAWTHANTSSMNSCLQHKHRTSYAIMYANWVLVLDLRDFGALSFKYCKMIFAIIPVQMDPTKTVIFVF